MNKRYLNTFVVLFCIELLTGIIYMRTGQWVFKPQWKLDTIAGSLIHLVWMVMIFSPTIYGFVLWHLKNQHRQMAIIQDKNNKFESLFLQNSSAIIVLDPTGKPLRCNPMFQRVSGYTLEEFRAMDHTALQDILQYEKWAGYMQQAIQGEDVGEFEVSLKTKNGQTRILTNSIIPMNKFQQIGGYYVVMRDITDTRQAQLRIWRMAHIDELTTLCNRRTFTDHLKTALEFAQIQSRKLGVLFIDLDGFKTLNDGLGHSVGDGLLRVVGQRINGCIVEIDGDSVVARFGGDEFAVLLPSIDNVSVPICVAERILTTIQPPCSVSGYELSIGASIGIAIYPVSGDSSDSLLQSAGQAMYNAKRNGRNRYAIHLPSMQQATYSRLKIENDLRRAVHIGNEFFVEYQPQVDIRTGQIVSAEALVRWQHPLLGRVPPIEFIPVAEDIGLIGKIGEVVLRTVCEQIRSWKNHNIPAVPIGINVSASELSEDHFVEKFGYTLQRFHVAPELIAIEITETSLMKNEQKARAAIYEFRNMGIKVFIDDFGQGYNSLGMLKHLSLDYLKIDRAFVSNIQNSLIDRSIVSTLISLAHFNQWKVVAEGVETLENLQVLAEENCDLYQGYFFSPPLTAQEFENKSVENFLQFQLS